MRTASTLEVFGGSHITAYGNQTPDRSTGALVAAQLGATEYPLAQNGLVLAAQGNGFARYVRPASVRRSGATGPYGWPPAADLVIVNCGLLDLATSVSVGSNWRPTPFRKALDAVCAFASLGGYMGAEPSGGSDASIAYGGSWTDVAQTDRCVGAGYRATFTQGSTITITVPVAFPGGEIDLFWVIGPSGYGGTIQINVTGATRTSAREVIDATWADQVTTTQLSYAVTRLTGLQPGAHTITITAESILSFGFGFDGWGIRSPAAPNIVLCSQLKAPQSTLEAFLGAAAADTPTAATIDRLNNEVILAVANQYDNAYYHEQPNILIDRPGTTADGMHPNDLGHRLLAAELLDTIDDLPNLPPAAAVQPVTATLAANWTAAGGSYAAPSYTVLPRRRIRLAGRIARTGTPAAPELLFTLPDRHRPAKTATFALAGSTGTPVVDIASDGTVTYRAGSLGASGTIDLDGVEFAVDAAS